MPLSINTNIASLTAQRAMLNSNSALETSFERLSTGKRVNSASDDAAGLAIGKDLESRVSGLNQAIRNVNDGISMVQIAEGTLDEVTSILQRMRDLAVQAANGAMGSTEQGYLDAEMSKLSDTLNDVVDTAQFNGTDLVGVVDKSFTIQSGADTNDTTGFTVEKLSSSVLDVTNARIDLTAASATAETAEIIVGGFSTFAQKTFNLEVDNKTYSVTLTSGENATHLAADLATALSADVAGTTVTSTGDGTGAGHKLQISWGSGGNHLGDYKLTHQDGTSVTGTVTQDGIDTASTAITTIDRALAAVASDRAGLGATQQQLESTVRNLANVAENTAAAQGRIMDTEYAAETANLTKAQILQQAATSILAQANAQPQAVLSLLQ